MPPSICCITPNDPKVRIYLPMVNIVQKQSPKLIALNGIMAVSIVHIAIMIHPPEIGRVKVSSMIIIVHKSRRIYRYRNRSETIVRCITYKARFITRALEFLPFRRYKKLIRISFTYPSRIL